MNDFGDFSGSNLAEPSNDLTPVPAGIYDLEVVESEIKPTRDGTGSMVNLTLKIVTGPFENRRIWSRHTLKNKNPQAEQIGRQQLSDLSRACGMTMNPANPSEWHGIPIRASVGIETDKTGQYEPKNIVKRFIPAGETGPAPVTHNPTPRQTPPAHVAQGSGSAPPAAGQRLPAFMQNRAGS